jgi:hypothetical protein
MTSRPEHYFIHHGSFSTVDVVNALAHWITSNRPLPTIGNIADPSVVKIQSQLCNVITNKKTSSQREAIRLANCADVHRPRRLRGLPYQRIKAKFAWQTLLCP